MNTSTAFSIKVVKAPNQVLRINTKPVKKITPELVKIAREMIKLAKTFKDPEGVGLASTQIGRKEKFFVAKIGKDFISKKEADQLGGFIICFNPTILSTSKKTKVYFEGCLSIPDYYGEAERFLSARVYYQDETGKEVIRRLTGVSAWIFQHEMDHLNGTLFMDHVLTQKGKIYKVVGRDKTGAEIFEEIKLI